MEHREEDKKHQHHDHGHKHDHHSHKHSKDQNSNLKKELRMKADEILSYQDDYNEKKEKKELSLGLEHFLSGKKKEFVS